MLFAVLVALARLWRSYGVEPAAVVGHSQGEIAAAHVAGALSLDDAAEIMAARAALIPLLRGRGTMMAVALPAAELAPRLERFGTRLSVAAHNGPRALTVSGDVPAVEELEEELVAAGVRARRIRAADGAGHSAEVDPFRADLVGRLAGIAPRAAEVEFVSTVTADTLETTRLTADYWFANARRTVRFDAAVRRLLAAGHRAFLEISPHPLLVGAIDDIAEDTGVEVVAAGSLRRDDGDLDRFLVSAAELYARGTPVDWTAALPRRPVRPVDLPTYPFQRRRHWVDGGGAAAVPAQPSGLADPAPHRPDDDAPADVPAGPPVAEQLAGLTAAEQVARLTELIRAHIAAVLRYPSIEDVPADQRFPELGLDSLTSVELRNRLAAATGGRLSGAAAVEHPSPVELARHLQAVLAGGPAAGPPATDSLVQLFAEACRAGRASAARGMLEQAAGLRPRFDRAEDAPDRPAPLRLAEGPRPALVCFPPFVIPAGAEQLVRLAAPFRGDRGFWALPHPGFGRDEALPGSLAVLRRRQAELALRCAGDRAPVLVGYSSGGWVAQAVAEELTGLGRPPAAVVLLDAFTLGADDATGVFDELMAAGAARSGLAGVTGAELTAMGWYLALFEPAGSPPRTGVPTLLVRAAEQPALRATGGRPPAPPGGVTATVEVPGDHVSMLTDHAAATAAAVESWLAAEEDRCRAARSDSSR